jgi:hypothetical protein
LGLSLVFGVDRAVTVKVSCGVLAVMLARGLAHACACGCGIFDVGTSSMFPSGPGAMAYVQDAYQDQDHNRSGTAPAPAADNDDKEIQTDFLMLGLQYMFNGSWGAQIEVPYDFRYFRGTDPSGNIAARGWNQLGDIRVEGIYTGFFPDLSAGVTLGVKLPTGSHSFDPELVDRDTQIGTGSTDILLGGFYRGALTKDGKWAWFAQMQLDVPTLIQDEYRPGVELDTAAGIDYRGLSLGRVRILPLAQVLFSERTGDSGVAADPGDTGYQRILLSPGIELHIHPVIIYADAEIPVYQNFTGNQLAAPVLFKVILSYMF